MARYVDAELIDLERVSDTICQQQAQDAIDDTPTADVVDGETYRNLLMAAKKMHCWIFLNTDDELSAYDECGLTDEMNALLGYDGQFTVKMDGGADDAVDN